MSEYLKDSGHRTMRTCDGCGGAFHCGDVEDRDEGEDDSAPDWTCETCTKSDAVTKALADALAGLLREEPNIYEGRLEASLYVTVDALDAARAALRLAGRLS